MSFKAEASKQLKQHLSCLYQSQHKQYLTVRVLSLGSDKKAARIYAFIILTGFLKFISYDSGGSTLSWMNLTPGVFLLHWYFCRLFYRFLASGLPILEDACLSATVIFLLS